MGCCYNEIQSATPPGDEKIVRQTAEWGESG